MICFKVCISPRDALPVHKSATTRGANDGWPRRYNDGQRAREQGTAIARWRLEHLVAERDLPQMTTRLSSYALHLRADTTHLKHGLGLFLPQHGRCREPLVLSIAATATARS